uniref:PX domain-containing protein n=1 Tax=Macrostomum lignano TaxID=282301 RepID=A0A1I8FLB9_9PLAT
PVRDSPQAKAASTAATSSLRGVHCFEARKRLNASLQTGLLVGLRSLSRTGSPRLRGVRTYGRTEEEITQQAICEPGKTAALAARLELRHVETSRITAWRRTAGTFWTLLDGAFHRFRANCLWLTEPVTCLRPCLADVGLHSASSPTARSQYHHHQAQLQPALHKELLELLRDCQGSSREFLEAGLECLCVLALPRFETETELA